MNLVDLLKRKLKADILKELKEYHFDEILLNSLIDLKVNETEITIDPKEPETVNSDNGDDNTCCARVMGPRYSERRCPWNKQPSSEYCKTHSNTIDKQGYLSFGRYDEEKPVINEKGNKIPWRDYTAMEDIDTVIQYQNMKLMKLIKL
tara:strand:- start:519 stop:962 length:444 start_codon:yes stop_codon:yes gene_type:complete